MKELGLYNYSKLKGRIREQNYTQEDIARGIHINSATLSQKLSGKGMFKQTEISAISVLLKIAPTEIGEYFFAS